MLLGDHADDVAAARHPTPAHDDRHHRALAPHAANDVERHVVLADHGEVEAGDVAEGDAGLRRLQAAPDAGVDAQDPVDPPVSLDHHVAHAARMLRLAQVGVEAHSAGSTWTSLTITSRAGRTMNMLACRALGIA